MGRRVAGYSIAARLARACALGLLTLALSAAGCSLVGKGETSLPSTSVQKLEYFPYEVKGYQNRYPDHTILVLIPVDKRSFVNVIDADHTPMNGDPAIGVVRNRSRNIIEQLYAAPLAPLVQRAIARSAEEAGLIPSPASTSVYQPTNSLKNNYVLAATITQCWVNKIRGPDNGGGPTWKTEAHFALAVKIYKPPFTVPFWQGVSSQVYDDPPVGSFALGPEDQVGIYDRPGQVLSLALTRSVAGIFDRTDLHTLMIEDRLRAP